MAEFNAQLNALSAEARGDKQKPNVSTSDVKVVPARTPNLPLTLQTSPETVTKVTRPPETAKTPAPVLVCAPNTLTAIPLSYSIADMNSGQGVDPITILLPKT